jgi:hypothetical protein
MQEHAALEIAGHLLGQTSQSATVSRLHGSGRRERMTIVLPSRKEEAVTQYALLTRVSLSCILSP